MWLKQATRDTVKVEIKNFLWNETKGLPECYSVEEIDKKTEDVYIYIYQRHDHKNLNENNNNFNSQQL